MDPQCGSFFKTRLDTVTSSKSIKATKQWVSKKQILSEYSDSEAEEMIQNGSLEYRKNPLNKSRLQFRRVTVVEEDEWKKGHHSSVHCSQH